MAVFRKLQISYWQDDFVNELTPEEKYFYIYLMTNSMTTQCGIYKLNKRLAEYETGYARDTIEKLLSRFVDCGKVLVSEATKEIMIVNWIRYNFINSRNTITCINSELKSVKEVSFVEKFYNVCRKNDYPVELIFKGMDLPFVEAACKEFQGACEEPGEEKVEVKVKEKDKEKGEAEDKVKKAMEAAANNFNELKDDFTKVIDAFNNNIHPMTPIEYERLMDWLKEMEAGVVLLAIEEAVGNNGRSMRYINTVLNSWNSLGLNTEAGVRAYIRERRDYKEKLRKGSENDRINAAAYRYIED